MEGRPFSQCWPRRITGICENNFKREMTRISWDWQKNRKVHNKENIENFTSCIDYFFQDRKSWLSLGQGAEDIGGHWWQGNLFSAVDSCTFWSFYHMHLLVFQIVKQYLKRHGHVVDTAHSLLIPTSYTGIRSC